MTEFLISALLTIAPSLFPRVESWLYTPPDTPAADVVRIKPPFALVKDHSKGPNPPTELAQPCPNGFGCQPPQVSARLAGREMLRVWWDVERVTMAGDWLVSQDRLGQFLVFNLSGTSTYPIWLESLNETNKYLAYHDSPPVSDADFRTFEELAEERKWRQVTRAGWGLAAVAVGWGGVAGLVCLRRRA